MTDSPVRERAPSRIAVEDHITPFQVDRLDVRGRVVALGPVLNAILSGHDYPEPVSRLLGEAVTLGILLGASLKFEGRFILQTQGDGPVGMLVVDFETPDKVRACARFDAERLAATRDTSPAALLGKGHLAMTIDQGPDMQRYQGVVELAGEGLEAAAHQYFASSEQIPTVVRLAVGQAMTSGEGAPASAWRAGGLLVQFLPSDPSRARQADIHPGDAPAGTPPHLVPEDDAWVEARSIAATVEDHELIDPRVSSETLLWRLFHESGVRVFEPRRVVRYCRCSRDSVLAMLARFSDDDRAHMVEHGRVKVVCEFCSTAYEFTPAEVGLAP